jgi:hypothetical protein
VIVVADTTPLLYLSRSVLGELADEVWKDAG